MKAMEVEIALRNAVDAQRDFRHSADTFKYLSDKFIEDQSNRDEFLEKLAEFFTSYKISAE